MVGQAIQAVIVRQSKLRWPIPQEIFTIHNFSVLGVSRRAKYILIHTCKGTIIIHLGMSGCLRILKNAVPHQKHDHVDFILTNGLVLRYTDPRRFGAVLWTAFDPLQFPLLINLGPEPFSSIFNGNYLFRFAQKKKGMIKQLIMDQNIVVGIGNIYANEALFLAKILPFRSAFTLTLIECKMLVRCLKKILRKAISLGGTTLRNYLSATGKPGYFAQTLWVYGRQGEKCRSCQSALASIRIGQRSTIYCPDCQQ